MRNQQNDRWFTTKCGREVLLQAIHNCQFDRGFLEGDREVIRENVLANLPQTVCEIFPGTSALYIEELPETALGYPPLMYFCEFTCFSGIDPFSDFSFLTTVWFGGNISRPIPEFIAPRMIELDWSSHACDGY